MPLSPNRDEIQYQSWITLPGNRVYMHAAGPSRSRSGRPKEISCCENRSNTAQIKVCKSRNISSLAR